MLSYQKIVVVGAGGLLGAQLVYEIVNAGGRVLAADIDIDTLAARLESSGLDLDADNVELIQLDITDELALKQFFKEQKGLTGAVNSTYPRNKSYGAHFFDVTLESFNDNVSMHLGSAFLFMQQCAQYFNHHQSPMSVVNISSIYGVVAPKFEVYEGTAMSMPVEYAAIKSAIIHLNKYVAAYVKDSRFRMNSVSPGGILDRQPETFLDAYANQTHGKGMLDMGDVVGTILFLLSDNSRYVTGQNIIVDDGFTL